MADLDRRYAQGTTVGRAETGVIDQGLRSYMLRVYNYMVLGLAVTAIAAVGIYLLSVTDARAAKTSHSTAKKMYLRMRDSAKRKALRRSWDRWRQR